MRERDGVLRIQCLEEREGAPTPTLRTTANGLLATGTDSDNSNVFDVAWEQRTGTTAIAVYSDATATARLKKYDAANRTWDVAATSLPAVGSGTVRSVELIPAPLSDDVAILVRSTNRRVYSVFWNGLADALYASGDGRDWVEHSTESGVFTSGYSHAFAWDLFGQTPTVVTLAAAPAASTATLTATVNPKGAPATAWFRLATTPPPSCNDTFGVRVPDTGGVAVSAGAAPVAVAQLATGLTARTTYHACALAQNGAGVSFGEVVSFQTLPGPPAQLVVLSGNGQSAVVSTAFSQPLRVRVLDGSGNDVVDGTQVQFQAPATGPSATFDDTATPSLTVTTTAGVVVTSGLRANGQEGAFVVSVQSGAAAAELDLTNLSTASLRLHVTSGAQAVPALQCSPPVDFETRAANGAATAVSAETNVSLASSSPSGRFFSDPFCTLPLTAVALAPGSSAGWFHWIDPQPGPATLSLSSPGMASTALEVQVTAPLLPVGGTCQASSDCETGSCEEGSCATPPAERRLLRVGCGCATNGGRGSALVLLGAVLARGRRRALLRGR